MSRKAAAVEAIRRLVEDAAGTPPEVFLILGSGLGGVRERVDHAVELPFGRVPGYPETSVAGHPGQFVAGRLGGAAVLVQAGRLHPYEGHPPDRVALSVRVAAALGATTLILTNAAGGIRSDLEAGSIVLLDDCLNLTFLNPLVGPVRRGEQRFPDMSNPFDPELRRLARAVARQEGVRLEEGTYAGVSGPSFETPAEIRMLRRLGGDVVGMSTVTEVLQARALGLRTLAFSLVTNRAAGVGGLGRRLSHEEVTETAVREGPRLGWLVEGVVRRLASLSVTPPGRSSARERSG